MHRLCQSIDAGAAPGEALNDAESEPTAEWQTLENGVCEAKYGPLEDGPGDGRKAMLNEALQVKDLDNGRTLLMHAAAAGNKAWFHHLVKTIRHRVRMEGDDDTNVTMGVCGIPRSPRVPTFYQYHFHVKTRKLL